MSEVRLYVDEDAGETAVVQGLRARGIDVLTDQRCSIGEKVRRLAGFLSRVTA